MKLALVGVVLITSAVALYCSESHATNFHNPLQPNINQNQFQGQIQGQAINNINGGSSVEFNDKLQIPNAPGLSSGSSNTTSPYRLYKQRQISTILGGGTYIDMVIDLPAFIGSNPSEDAQLGACVQDTGFKEYRRLKGNPCPE